ncbi:MAG: FtsW/RodA/SpoVE family cell cycle protein [Acetatifactor sp.]
MRQYFMELSKYGIMICMMLYTLASITTLFIKEKGRIASYIIQSVFLFITQLICFLSLALASGEERYFLLYAFIQVFLLVALIFIPLIYEKINLPLLNIMCMFIGTGLFIIARLSFEKSVKQYIIMLISLVFALLIPYVLAKCKFIPKLTWVYGLLGIAALGIVLILGEVTHGSKISYTLFGGITFQPSEFVKIVFVFFLAGALCEKHTFDRVLLTAIVAGSYVAVLVLSKDLGSALIFFVGYIFIVFAATANYFYLLAGILGGGAAAYAANLLFRHVHIRVLAWRDPWAYIDKEGWAITQSLFAMGSGSWFGMGILKGNPKSIPYVDQDFIFSCICEELGIVFGVCLVILTLVCFLLIGKIALQVKNNFYRLVAFGLGIMYLFQIFLTVGGGMNLIPLTGVTLPFISYGGSSCMTTMILFFIIQGIYINCQDTTELGVAANAKNAIQATDKETGNKMSKSKRAAGQRVHPFYVSVGMFTILFVFMMGYLVRFVTMNEQDLVNNSYNSRQEILLSQNYRGTIYSRDGEILAHTVIDSAGNENRVYPFENLFSHVVGYSTNGRMGVEAIANYYLINTNISVNNKVANDMAGVKNPGDNVYTTLDVQIQEIADSELNIYKGAIIVTEVSTGKILALVSHPDFDPNEIMEIWSDLLEDKEDTSLLNRATQGLYPPGSTFKIMTSLEYIREFSDNIDGYAFQCTGYYKKGENRINCYHGSVHNLVNFTDSFAKSCNSSFANIGMNLDREAFANTLEGLLFGKELPLTLQYSKSSIAINKDMSDYDMMQTSIGQGKTLITPMHLNMITCAIANNGVLMEPYLIDSVVSDDGRIVKSFKPQQYGRLMTVDEADKLKELMTAVVEKGTASKLKGRSYTAAGKTGSAEYGNVKGESHAWFTGFAPADNPEVCVTIIVEGAGSGGDYAVPIARRIFDRYFAEK